MRDWKKIISEWDTLAMAVFATELVCGKCHNYMGAVIFEKEESSNEFTQSNNELLCESCFQELKKAVKDSRTPIKEK
jgi:bacterioferritin-associated ferredoxin